jgi:hypothetical protein
VQNVIGDALGLSEFRLFPTTITDDKRRTSTLGLSAEAGVDVTRNLSVSLLKELTTDQPLQYSLRYRLNDQLLLRGSTDLSGDSRAVWSTTSVLNLFICHIPPDWSLDYDGRSAVLGNSNHGKKTYRDLNKFQAQTKPKLAL